MASTGVRQMLLRLMVGVESRLPGSGRALVRPRLYIDACPAIRARTRHAHPAASSVHASVKPEVDSTRPKDDLVGDVVTESKAAAEAAAAAESNEIWYDELVELLDAGKIRIVDVRKPSEIDDLGMIPSSVNIPLNELSRSLMLNKDQFRVAFGIEKPSKNNDQLVFYALRGDTSASAVEIAKRLGYKRARHYVGGWYEWSMKTKNDC